MRRLILGALALVAAVILIQSMPDLVRYLKIERM
jgi:hypothetical protein